LLHTAMKVNIHYWNYIHCSLVLSFYTSIYK
jgi:hypothetical protein